MTQTLTLKAKLHPTKEQMEWIKEGCFCYIQTINSLVEEMVLNRKSTNKTSKHIEAPLNSAVKNQAIKDAKSVFKKVKESNYTIIPILKKPQIVWNNQNYEIYGDSLEVPFMINGKSTRVKIKADLTNRMFHQIAESKLGTLRITKKSNRWVAQISLTLPCEDIKRGQSMGIDLGLLVPAVARTERSEVKFFGNGRQNKYIRRKYKSRRRKLGKLKKLSAIKKLNNKEQRYMDNQDHQVSREIINFAKEKKVTTIKLECLEGIRNTTKISRKNKNNLHTWSFYRVAKYIEYKAKLEGISVEYVDPKYTSQKCPNCGKHHKANGRNYKCKDCGFQLHRDLVGATNILTAPVIDGNSQSA